MALYAINPHYHVPNRPFFTVASEVDKGSTFTMRLPAEVGDAKA